MGLTSVLDIAQPGDKILIVSFGSGAGSNAFVLRITERIEKARDKAQKTRDMIDEKNFMWIMVLMPNSEGRF